MGKFAKIGLLAGVIASCLGYVLTEKQITLFGIPMPTTPVMLAISMAPLTGYVIGWLIEYYLRKPFLSISTYGTPTAIAPAVANQLKCFGIKNREIQFIAFVTNNPLYEKYRASVAPYKALEYRLQVMEQQEEGPAPPTPGGLAEASKDIWTGQLQQIEAFLLGNALIPSAIVANIYGIGKGGTGEGAVAAGVPRMVNSTLKSRFNIDVIITSRLPEKDIPAFQKNLKVMEDNVSAFVSSDISLYLERENEAETRTQRYIARILTAFSYSLYSSQDEPEKIRILEQRLFVPIILDVRDPFSLSVEIEQLVTQPKARKQRMPLLAAEHIELRGKSVIVMVVSPRPDEIAASIINGFSRFEVSVPVVIKAKSRKRNTLILILVPMSVAEFSKTLLGYSLSQAARTSFVHRQIRRATVEGPIREILEEVEEKIQDSQQKLRELRIKREMMETELNILLLRSRILTKYGNIGELEKRWGTLDQIKRMISEKQEEIAKVDKEVSGIEAELEYLKGVKEDLLTREVPVPVL